MLGLASSRHVSNCHFSYNRRSVNYLFTFNLGLLEIAFCIGLRNLHEIAFLHWLTENYIFALAY